MTSEDKLRRDGYFRPTYLSLVARATLSRHTGRPILESFNPVYHYWATHRDLTRAETARYLGPGYVRSFDVAQTEDRARARRHAAGDRYQVSEGY